MSLFKNSVDLGHKLATIQDRSLLKLSGSKVGLEVLHFKQRDAEVDIGIDSYKVISCDASAVISREKVLITKHLVQLLLADTTNGSWLMLVGNSIVLRTGRSH